MTSVSALGLANLPPPGPVLVPLRLLLTLLTFLLSYTVSAIALAGRPEDMDDTPLESWRKVLREAVFLMFRSPPRTNDKDRTGNTLCRGLVFCLGIMVRVTGTPVPAQEAPLLVAAPHHTLLDWVRWAGPVRSSLCIHVSAAQHRGDARLPRGQGRGVALPAVRQDRAPHLRGVGGARGPGRARPDRGAHTAEVQRDRLAQAPHIPRGKTYTHFPERTFIIYIYCIYL